MWNFEDLKNVVKFEEWIVEEICKHKIPESLSIKLVELCSKTTFEWLKSNGYSQKDIGLMTNAVINPSLYKPYTNKDVGDELFWSEFGKVINNAEASKTARAI